MGGHNWRGDNPRPQSVSAPLPHSAGALMRELGASRRARRGLEQDLALELLDGEGARAARDAARRRRSSSPIAHRRQEVAAAPRAGGHGRSPIGLTCTRDARSVSRLARSSPAGAPPTDGGRVDRRVSGARFRSGLRTRRMRLSCKTARCTRTASASDARENGRPRSTRGTRACDQLAACLWNVAREGGSRRTEVRFSDDNPGDAGELRDPGASSRG